MVDRGGYPVPIGGGTIPPANGVDGMSTLAVFDGTSSSAIHTKLSENIKQFLVKQKKKTKKKKGILSMIQHFYHH